MKIKKIFLNENHLTDMAAECIAEVIQEGNTRIREIGLKGNQITAKGGNKFASALVINRDLKVLDLSWNILGVKPFDVPDRRDPGRRFKSLMQDGDIGKAWGSAVRENKTLIHLDLSFNRIGLEDTESIQSAIREN